MARDTSPHFHEMFQQMLGHEGRLAPSKTGRDKLRLELFEKQQGQCYWHDKGQCRHPNKPMSLDRVMVSEISGRIKFNGLFATFEHIVRRYDGGKSTRENMALAHAKCNMAREKTMPPNGKKWRHLLPDAHLRKKTSGGKDGQGTDSGGVGNGSAV